MAANSSQIRGPQSENTRPRTQSIRDAAKKGDIRSHVSPMLHGKSRCSFLSHLSNPLYIPPPHYVALIKLPTTCNHIFLPYQGAVLGKRAESMVIGCCIMAVLEEPCNIKTMV